MVKSVARIRYKRISGIGIPVVVKHRSVDHRLRYLHTTECCSQTSLASLQTKLNKSTQPIQADCIAIDSQLVERLCLPYNSWKGWVISQDGHRKLCDAQQRIERRVVAFSREFQQWDIRNSAIKELEKPHLSLTFQTRISFSQTLILPLHVPVLFCDFHIHNQSAPVSQDGRQMTDFLQRLKSVFVVQHAENQMLH
jgi:hypothetical protein